jgi:hypothetical protein
MKLIYLIIASGLLLLAACASPTAAVPDADPLLPATGSEDATEVPTTESPPTPSPTPENPLGTLSLEENQVLHGQDENALERLLEKAAFFEKDLIQVIEGGEAVLDFGDQMRLRLFNDTELQMVAADLAEDVPLGVQVFLFVGGFTGELTEEGGQAVFRTPGDVEITVLGTEYFVVYDPQTRETTVGNFSGTVAVASAGDEVSLEDGSYVVVPDGSPPGPQLPLPLTREEFEDQAREYESPLLAASKAKEWTLEIRHEFSSESEGEVVTFLRLWTGKFILEGDEILGSGTGVIEDMNLNCLVIIDFWNDITKDVRFNLEGSYDFDIGGKLVDGEGGRPAFLFEITANNLEMDSLTSVAEEGDYCETFAEFFPENNRVIVEDLPLLDAEAIIVAAADGAQAAYLMDEQPYDFKGSIYFKHPIEVIVSQGQ